MSYKPVPNDDSLSELISRMNDVNMMSKNMMNSRGDFDSFAIWLYKCVDIDKRSTYFILKKNSNQLSEREWQLCVKLIPKLAQERGDI
jgi:hypothetical protein